MLVENKINPMLRFKDDSGSDYSDWERKKLRDISKFYDSTRIPLSKEERNKKQGLYPYYGASGIIDHVEDYLFDGEYILLGEDGANIVMRNSPLAYLATGKFWVNNHAHVIQSNESNTFLCEALERINYIKYNTGTAQPKLNAEVCKKITLVIPAEPEQQKIANFLSSVDTKIEQLSKKQNLLAQYKKGMMQKLFSQIIRFKADDGSDYPDWDEKRLGDISNRSSVKNKDNQVRDVFTNSAVEGIVNQRDYFDKDIANKNNLDGYYIVNKNDFVYNPRISSTAPVGPLKRNHLNTGVMSPLYNVFTISNIYLDFIEMYFQTTFWHKYMHSIANIGARHDRMNVTNSDFFKMPILIPSKDEQNKIANFLLSIDKKIEQVTKQLTQAKQFKKALLQQMFV